MATPPPSLLTLTTDFGREDFHLPRLKGYLLSAAPTLRIEDISHEVPPYDIVRAAFIFNRVWRHYPAGTIHLLSVNDFYQPRGRFIAVRHERHYFIGPDNGLFSLVFGRMPAETYVLDGYKKTDALSAIYARAVAHIARDKPFLEIGLPATRITERLAFQPVIGPNYVRGTVVFVDRFDNVTTNISRDRFEEVGQGRGFHLLIKRMAPIDGLSFRYHDVPEGEPLCRFNSDGLLEIAINLGRAATLLGIQMDDMVQVEFY
ncbi:SAM-dependent chlorinase/fluorinase [Neolewinella lacunae]|uniref:SAM-dependent chlorinase/fluorinase n=1 Tax=Neolewinella lacunae TaxID=1517758 RepID=A0A923PPN8_9BACT|nr:SAM-dependent chlorinase/fluorinase [Neolewinella lacunae]MBC6994417.1 SAM-dependent chlorinase/fluorinase [Neolewinella lacunae]MDN3633348.1 SAM-dependent chlorinase/fluorinase [Neolewinella lacunae]